MELSAGAATRDISPPRGSTLYGYPHVPRHATGTHDPLLASVLVLDNGETVLALVALDLLFLAPPMARDLRRRVAAALGTPGENVLAGCTHTHSGPVTAPLLAWRDDPAIPAPDPGYLAGLCDTVCAAAADAAARRVPAALAWTAADATGVGGNRLEPGGLTDPECGILAVRDRTDSRLLAAALVYGMHPTVLHEDSTLVTADFPHYARLCLRERFGEGTVVLYHNAPCGNQSPRHFVQAQTFAEAERLGRKLGGAAVSAMDALADDSWQSTARLAGAIRAVDLPRRTLPSIRQAGERLRAARRHFETLKQRQAPVAETRTAECAVFGAEGALTLARCAAEGEVGPLLDACQPIEVQALRIGDTCLAGLPGECFTEYALDLKERCVCRTFVVSFVNGELQGYVVTPEAAARGGYEATNALFAPQSGDVMVAALAELAAELMNPDTNGRI